MLHAAPLPEFSGDQDFQQFLQKDLEYIRKIKGDVAQVQELVVSRSTQTSGRGIEGSRGLGWGWAMQRTQGLICDLHKGAS